MQTMQIIMAGVIALGGLIFVHELGHFLVAKAAGIRVLKFSLGFGATLVGFKWGETECVLSVLPLGGYVKMAGEILESEKPEDIKPGDYFSRPWWVRILVLLAGPGMNWVTAVVVLGLLFWIGFMVPIAKPQIMNVEQNSPAAAAGLLAGDIVTHLENEPVENWEDFSDRLNTLADANPNQALSLVVNRKNQVLHFTAQPVKDPKTERWRLGIAIAPAATTLIDRVIVGTPAELAGLHAQDQVIAVEGQPVLTKYDFQQIIWARAEQPTRITVQRGAEMVELKVTPMAQQLPEQGRVGVIGVNFKTSNLEQRRQYPFGEAFALGTRQTVMISQMILSSLWHMITGKISAKDSVGGPITIMRMAGQEARAGAKDFFFFLAGISIMLAIINLLPIPILDGGNALFFLLEGIMRRRVSVKVQDVFQRVGFTLLVALMVYATYNDIYKLIAPVFGGTP